MSKSVAIVGVKSTDNSGKRQIQACLPSSVKIFDIQVEMDKFKLGSLDAMLQGLDRIARLELQTENFLKRIEKIFLELEPEKNLYLLTIDVMHAGPITLGRYLQAFTWDDSNYPRSPTLQNQVKMVEEKIESLDKILKIRQQSYIETKTKLASPNERKDTLSSFINGDLNDLVYELVSKKVISAPDSLFKNTEYFQSLIVFIPKTNLESFQQNYELDVEYIVPQSFIFLHENFDFIMGTVLGFKRGLDEIKTTYKKKYSAITREYEMNMEGARIKEIEKKKMGEQNITDKNQLKNSALETFKEIIIMLIHIKMYKVIIDSNLRFGGSQSFSINVLMFDKGKEQRIIQELIKSFAEQEKIAFYGTKEQLNDVEDFFPFVYNAFNFLL